MAVPRDFLRSLLAAAQEAERAYQEGLRDGQSTWADQFAQSQAEVTRLRAALEPFGSGAEWGAVKAWIVAGAEAGTGEREIGVKVAAQLTRWQVAADAALRREA